MGYKTIKQHYDIKHIVAIYDKEEYGGTCICIGSPYCHDIIVIRVSDSKVVKRYNKRGYTANEDLVRYDEALKIDEHNGALRKLIDAPDLFESNLPVFTISGGFVVQEFCEEYGYPNTTHEGNIMYTNTYFNTRNEAYRYLLQNTILHLRGGCFWREIGELITKIRKRFYYLIQDACIWLIARSLGRLITKRKRQ